MKKKEIELLVEQSLNNLSKINCSNKIKAQSLVEYLEMYGVILVEEGLLNKSTNFKVALRKNIQ